jgi:hypothetical protein
MMVSQGNFKGVWTLKINCNNKHCWINYILLLKKRVKVFPLLCFQNSKVWISVIIKDREPMAFDLQGLTCKPLLIYYVRMDLSD